jgi:hypothetical protein
MILDSKLVFANNVSAAANNAVVSTNVNVIDTAASATLQNANADIGTGKEIWVKAVATVAFTTAMNVNFRLNHGSANNVANTALDGPTISTTTNLDPTNFANATDAQKTIYDGPLPAGLQRWIRGSLYCAGNVAAGNFDCYLYVK